MKSTLDKLLETAKYFEQLLKGRDSRELRRALNAILDLIYILENPNASRRDR